MQYIEKISLKLEHVDEKVETNSIKTALLVNGGNYSNDVCNRAVVAQW